MKPTVVAKRTNSSKQSGTAHSAHSIAHGNGCGISKKRSADYIGNSTPSTGDIGNERNQNYEFKISQDR